MNVYVLLSQEAKKPTPVPDVGKDRIYNDEIYFKKILR
jgi:hypothetical protein